MSFKDRDMSLKNPFSKYGKRWELIWKEKDGDGEYHRAIGYYVHGIPDVSFYQSKSIHPVKKFKIEFLVGALRWTNEEKMKRLMAVKNRR